MARGDITVKNYMSDKVVFSDLINGSFFHGMEIVKPENLTQLEGESDLYLTDKNGNKKTVMRYWDVVMRTDFAIIAEENQMNVHYAMPIRNMLYDALSYTEQVEQIRKEHERKGEKLTGSQFLSGMKKEDRIIPVITIVVYYGEEEWDGSLDLYGMMGLEENELITRKLKDILPNYKINLLHAGNIDNPDNYKSSLQLVFGMLKYKSNKAELKKYLEKNREKLETVDEETYRVIGVLLHEEKRLEKYRKREEVGLSMCKAIEEMIQDGKQEGRQEGRKEGRQEGKIEGKAEGRNEEKLRIAKELKGLLPDEVIAEKTELALEIVKNISADSGL